VNSKRVTRNHFLETTAALAGATITAVRRHGKQILFELDRGGVLYIHLGMTGKLIWDGVQTKYARAILHLQNGVLIYDDVRQFGRFEFYADMPALLTKVGPDALDVTFEEFFTRLQKPSSPESVTFMPTKRYSHRASIRAPLRIKSQKPAPRNCTRTSPPFWLWPWNIAARLFQTT
jgi:formamidopyrimidine-DNA glycosylase